MIQDEINEAFSGAQWRDIPLYKYKIAANSEYNEFMEEMAHEWKWWVPAKTGEKIVEEFIDSIAFSLAIILHVSNKESLSEYLKTDFDSIDIVATAFNYKGLESIMKAWSNFIDAKDLRGMVLHLLVYVRLVSKHLNINDYDILEAFTAKHEKNLKRISSGYMETGIKKGLE